MQSLTHGIVSHNVELHARLTLGRGERSLERVIGGVRVHEQRGAIAACPCGCREPIRDNLHSPLVLAFHKWHVDAPRAHGIVHALRKLVEPDLSPSAGAYIAIESAGTEQQVQRNSDGRCKDERQRPSKCALGRPPAPDRVHRQPDANPLDDEDDGSDDQQKFHVGVRSEEATFPCMHAAERAAPTVRSPALAIIVAALGYFVDIFDLLLFAIVRVDSLKSLGVAQEQLKPVGLWLDNFLQVTGLVVGGIAWGILADRKGRLSVLFGSILTYSLANILNAFIADVPDSGGGAVLHALGLGSAVHQYGVLRFVAGFGLAGELGAGITLVAELVSPKRRGIATTMIATIGVLGAVAAFGITRLVDWRVAYLIGGGMGLLLLTLRIGVVESGMFEAVRTKPSVGRGSFWLLLYPRQRLQRYLCTIIAAVPIWYCIGILVKYCDAIGRSLGMPETALPSPGAAIMWAYIGLAMGDLGSGVLSQMLRSRRAALWVFHALTVVAVGLYFTTAASSLLAFYACSCVLGFAAGYWAVFVTMSAELFGTNLRATAATSAPNFVRWSAAGSALLWTTGERLLGGGPATPWQSAALVGALLIPLAMVAVFLLPETFGRDLDFEEA